MVLVHRRGLFVSLILLVMTGCAAPARVSHMVAYVPAPSAGQADTRWQGSMTLDAVLGGESTNPMWTSEVGNVEFQEALRQSLFSSGLLSGGNQPAKYGLIAQLMEVDQPIIGFDMTVISRVQYTVKEKASTSVAFDEIITAPFTASVGDSFLGVERLRLPHGVDFDAVERVAAHHRRGFGLSVAL